MDQFRRRYCLLFVLAPLAACSDSDASGTSFGGTAAATTGSTTGSSSTSTSGSEDGSGNHVVFDLPPPEVPPEEQCEPGSDLEGLGDSGTELPCSNEAPADAFSPELEWSYPPEVGTHASISTPLVANMTDDNGDGSIDTCDVPDVVVSISTEDVGCRIHVVSGDYAESGTVHAVFDAPPVACGGAGAIGDIDADGRNEIVVAAPLPRAGLVAIDDDFTLLWESENYTAPNYHISGSWGSGGVFIGDVNRDGSPEIAYNHGLWDADGNLVWQEPDNVSVSFLQQTVLVNLDGDEEPNLELITGYTAWRFDDALQPTKMWHFGEDEDGPLPGTSVPHVANFDLDPEPEVLLVSSAGHLLVDHDGTPVWDTLQGLADNLDDPLEEGWCPTQGGGWSSWSHMRPAVVANFDADEAAEIAMSRCGEFLIFDIDAQGMRPLWSAQVQDHSGASGATAFDFLGDGSPEAVYSDEVQARGWSLQDEGWVQRFALNRFSATMMEYPSVADADNDGSAEILVVSQNDAPALQVFGDRDNRWIQARRIWNQQAYFVTNVEEDGTIPRVQRPNWRYFNTWRVNSQIESGRVCRPPTG